MSQKVLVPDIGDVKDVEVIEILVKPGDIIRAEQSLITLESDKATMEVPSPIAGTVESIAVKLGTRVKTGSEILSLTVTQAFAEIPPQAPAPAQTLALGANEPGPDTQVAESPTVLSAIQGSEVSQLPTAPPTIDILPSSPSGAHAGPSVRRFARELGVDLSRLRGTGRKGRIVHEDVKAFVKNSLQSGADAHPESGQAPPEDIDFSLFGVIESRSLSRIQKLAGAHLQKSWREIPHVTQHGEADITELEAFRKKLKAELENQGIRFTLLPLVMKAVVYALQEFQDFNASLGPRGESLILKKYYHIGVAVDTPEGLVVPVVRNADRKGLAELARELAELGALARDKKLKPDQMRGASFTITSLGGIGGSAFTPIINHPEVAILGVSRAEMRPVFSGAQFVPRLILPLSLSYDHRVIDGAAAARFIVFLAEVLGDLRRLLI